MYDQEIINAVSQNNFNEVKVWLAKGADVNSRDQQGNLLIELAVYFQYQEIFEYLVNNNADLKICDINKLITWERQLLLSNLSRSNLLLRQLIVLRAHAQRHIEAYVNEDVAIIVNKLITTLLYESSRHGWDRKIPTELRIQIEYLAPWFIGKTKKDYIEYIQAQETQNNTFYGSYLSDDSDSDEEREFSKKELSTKNTYFKEAEIYRQRAQVESIFYKKNTRNSRKGELKEITDASRTFDLEARTTIHYGNHIDTNKIQRDLDQLNILLKRGDSITAALTFLQSQDASFTTFFVAQYRGITHLTTRWNQPSRKAHRKDQAEINKPQYSASVMVAAGFDIFRSYAVVAFKQEESIQKPVLKLNHVPQAVGAISLVEANNLAMQAFLGDGSNENSHLNFRTWYHPDVCHYLLQLVPNRAKCIRVIFADAGDNNTQTFKDQLQNLIMLGNLLKRPAVFISKEPGADNHYVCGLVKGNKLLLINPLGITKHSDCYKTFFELKDERTIGEVWFSSSRLQKREYEEGLVSCGPITLELATHILSQFTSEELENFWEQLKTNEPTTHEKSGLTYHGINIEALLPETLKTLSESTDETNYVKQACRIRQKHLQQLQTLPAQHAKAEKMATDDYLKKCKESALAQVLFNMLVTKEKTIANISELPEYQLFEQELNKQVTSSASQIDSYSSISDNPQKNLVTQFSEHSQQEKNVHPTAPKPLKAKAELLREILLTLREPSPYSYAGYTYANLAYLLQAVYTQDYDGFHRLIKTDPLLSCLLLNDYNPFLSTGDTPYHAEKYAYGIKPYKGHEGERLRPRWRSDGKAERPYSGVVYASLHPLSDFKQDGPLHLISLNHAAEIKLKKELEIISERESCFPAFLPEGRVFFKHIAKYPSFRGPYKQIYFYKYGLKPEFYQQLQVKLQRARPHTEEMKAFKKLLGEWLCSYYEVRLIDRARWEAEQRGGVLIYRNINGTFSLKPPIDSVNRNHAQMTEQVKTPVKNKQQRRSSLEFVMEDEEPSACASPVIQPIYDEIIEGDGFLAEAIYGLENLVIEHASISIANFNVSPAFSLLINAVREKRHLALAHYLKIPIFQQTINKSFNHTDITKFLPRISLLHLAILESNLEAVRLLLQTPGINVNLKPDTEENPHYDFIFRRNLTPLELAIDEGQIETVSLLSNHPQIRLDLCATHVEDVDLKELLKRGNLLIVVKLIKAGLTSSLNPDFFLENIDFGLRNYIQKCPTPRKPANVADDIFDYLCSLKNKNINLLTYSESNHYIPQQPYFGENDHGSTREIAYSLFSWFDTNNLKKSSIVCKAWKKLSNDVSSDQQFKFFNKEKKDAIVELEENLNNKLKI